VLADHIPALNAPLLATATCMYTTTPDHNFIVGLHPGHDNVVIASPCSGHGYKFASVIGEILADLATEGTSRHDIAMFDAKGYGISRG
jgi:sarcosine oxidase